MGFRRLGALLSAPLFVSLGLVAMAQGPKPRLAAVIDGSSRTVLAGSRPPQAARGVDQGVLASGTEIKGITLVFKRSDAQEADLQALLAAQQDTASPLYHQWLTPDQFAARFGVADSDIAKVETWLQGQGFAIDAVVRSKDRVVFDGTAGEVAAAFGTALHRYSFGAKTHFAPASDLSVPSELAPMVTTVLRLSDFHAHRQTKLGLAAAQPTPAYTSSQTGNHFLTPPDVATMYDLTSTYKAGYNGAGQSIAILGQSYVDATPVSTFMTATGISTKAFSYVLVPNTGVSGVNVDEDGDEGESQLDLEYAGGMAPGANVYLVYTGDNSNSGVFDSLSYAITENIAPVISGSYGYCETDLQVEGAQGSQYAQALAQQVEQANAQGQTVVFSTGDTGSEDCFGDGSLSTSQEEAPAVDFPGSVPYITAMGGLQMAAGTFASTNTTYWQSASGTDVVSSLLSYVPEAAWNESSTTLGLSSGGGGTSVLFTRPSWQANVPGIPSGSNRLVPDLALQASVNSPGYIYCTSDASDLSSEGITSSCTNGLRNSAGTFAVAGGTSFSAPIFAGMLAVLNQAKNATGQGNINPTLYSLAANSTVYSSAFHDVTSGSNACTLGSSYCSTSGASSYSAGTGYDEATGLGSIDFAKLLTAWPSSTGSALAPTVVTVSATSSTLTAGQTAQLSIAVSNASGSSSTVTPTGTGTVTLDGTVLSTPVTFSGTTVSYSFTVPGSTGSHVVTVKYSGDTTHAPSTGTAILTVGSLQASGSFALSASNITLPYNGTASGNFTITPASGYTGTVAFTVTYGTVNGTLCYEINPNSASSNVATPTGAPVNATLLMGEGTPCTSTAGNDGMFGHGQPQTGRRPRSPAQRWPEGVMFAGLLFAGLAFRRSRRLPALLGVVLLAAVGLGVSGCGGSSGSSGGGGTTTSPQTVTVTLKGTDTSNATITASTTFTLTIQ